MSITIRVIDFETTGIPTKDDPHAIVEIGQTDLVKYDHPGVSWEIRPRMPKLFNPNRPIPASASAVHHILDSDLPPYERGGIERALEWLTIIEGGKGRPIFAAHNARFERSFFDPEGFDWIDTYRCAVRIWPEAETHTNWGLLYSLGMGAVRGKLDAIPPHRAGPDAYVTAYVLRAMLKEHDVSELVAWTNEPLLLPRVTFGKHAGIAWSKAPIDYLEWVLRQDFEPDVLFTARYWLDRARR